MKLDEAGDRIMPYVFSQIMPGRDEIYNQNSTLVEICRLDTITGAFSFDGFTKPMFAGGTEEPPSDRRAPCAAGTEYSGREVGCRECPQGRYNPIPNSVCLPCAAGSAAPDGAALYCGICDAGSYAKSGSPACEPCPAGTDAGKAGQASGSPIGGPLVRGASGAVIIIIINIIIIIIIFTIILLCLFSFLLFIH